MKIAIVIVAIAIAGGVGYLYWRGKKAPATTPNGRIPKPGDPDYVDPADRRAAIVVEAGADKGPAAPVGADPIPSGVRDRILTSGLAGSIPA